MAAQLRRRERPQRDREELGQLLVGQPEIADFQPLRPAAQQPHRARGRLVLGKLAEYQFRGVRSYRHGHLADYRQLDRGPAGIVGVDLHGLAIVVRHLAPLPVHLDLEGLARQELVVIDLTDRAAAGGRAGSEHQRRGADILEDEVVLPLGAEIHRAEIIFLLIHRDFRRRLAASGDRQRRRSLPRVDGIAVPGDLPHPPEGSPGPHGDAAQYGQNDCQGKSHPPSLPQLPPRFHGGMNKDKG